MRSPATGCTSAGASSASGPEHPGPRQQVRVRQRLAGDAADAVAVQQQVEVERARAPLRRAGLASAGALDGLQPIEQLFRRQVRREADDEVDEVVAREADRRVRVGARGPQARKLALEQARARARGSRAAGRCCRPRRRRQPRARSAIGAALDDRRRRRASAGSRPACARSRARARPRTPRARCARSRRRAPRPAGTGSPRRRRARAWRPTCS